MTIGGAFLGGGVELVPAGSCKLVMEIRTEDGKNLATTFSVAGGGQTYTATAGADGRAELIVPSGVTYTVTTSATGYDGLTAQTVIGDSATAQYVRFEAILPRVKKSGDTMTGPLSVPAPPSDAKGNEVTTANWVLGKLSGKNGLTEFTSWAELKALIMSGKRGDTFCLTVDYNGHSSINGFEIRNTEIHAFGYFAIEELTVSSGELTMLEAFGGGEVRFNSSETLTTIRYFSASGFGMQDAGALGKIWAFRVPYEADLNYMYLQDEDVTACSGYYVSL